MVRGQSSTKEITGELSKRIDGWSRVVPFSARVNHLTAPLVWVTGCTSLGLIGLIYLRRRVYRGDKSQIAAIAGEVKDNTKSVFEPSEGDKPARIVYQSRYVSHVI